MSTTLSRRLVPALAVLFAASPAVAAEQPKRPPNVVFIFTDDQGYGDVGCYGAKGFTTPNLDRMAKQGVKFTQFYVSQPVCSASRTSLLTGCYANRLGIHGALGPGWLAAYEMIIGSVLSGLSRWSVLAWRSAERARLPRRRRHLRACA